ncbi:GNAT family N-acetyltransferase [Erysipelothrix sp. HDW6C]|uniref:GNAT family N-acetyltransferase n=1 Tax=Erysipelothrix sp. HDW6C TaxID=2714930 RepID=UPI00140A19ED|nr:GNAT family N-acetyltransferase [Erysipelothrix sp. HDW6C]QIK68912.1 GNAT family N-acetyltransferase [Erysipelothrix sp. HDW6C]
MIRLMEIQEIDDVMKIWLDTNIEVHHEVPASYWEGNVADVKAAMENSNIYVALKDDTIVGFAGVSEGYYLAGIFVAETHRSDGVGKALLDYLKKTYEEITLDVYAFNEGAVRFYTKESFVIVGEGMDEAHGLKELTMVWPENI